MDFVQPKPGATVKVIGAGLPRTGTNSFCAALSILLNGPTYHAGVQWVQTVDESHILTLLETMERRPYASTAQREAILARLKSRLDGYVATADPPLSLLVPELMELYPDAKVICTTRDPNSWAESMAFLLTLMHPHLFAFMFFWLPSLRYFNKMTNSLTAIFQERYGIRISSKETALATWDRHHAWLESIVPKEKFFYFNVKDGWEPLCKALDLPVPTDVDFPRLNDSKSIENAFKKLMLQGLLRWGVAVIVFGFLFAAAAWLLAKSRPRTWAPS